MTGARRRRRKAIGISGICLALSLPASVTGAAPGSDAFAARLAGSYLCDFDRLVGFAAKGLYLLATFHGDGTLTGSTLKDFGAPPFVFQNSPNYGSWVQSGPNRASATSFFFNFDRSSGALLAFSRLDADVEVVEPGTLRLEAIEYFLPVRSFAEPREDPLTAPGQRGPDFVIRCRRIEPRR